MTHLLWEGALSDDEDSQIVGFDCDYELLVEYDLLSTSDIQTRVLEFLKKYDKDSRTL